MVGSSPDIASRGAGPSLAETFGEVEAMSEPAAVSRLAGNTKPNTPPPVPPKSPVRPAKSRRPLLIGAAALVVIAGGVGAYIYLSRPDLPPGFAGGNGRLEANEIYVASKYPGRVKEMLA